MPEVRLLRALRDDAVIDITLERFEEMMLLKSVERPEPVVAGMNAGRITR